MNTHANDFLIRRAGHKQMLFIMIRMEFNAEWYFARGKAMNDVAGFRVPQFDVSIVAGRQELFAIIVPGHIFNGLPMTIVCSYATTLFVHLPDFNA